MHKIEMTDDGFLPVKIGEAEVLLDVYAVYNQIADVRRDAGGHADEFNRDLVELAAKLGFGTVSQRAACRLAEAVTREAAKLHARDAVERAAERFVGELREIVMAAVRGKVTDSVMRPGHPPTAPETPSVATPANSLPLPPGVESVTVTHTLRREPEDFWDGFFHTKPNEPSVN